MTTKSKSWLWEALENKGIDPYLVGIYLYFFKLSIILYPEDPFSLIYVIDDP